MAEGLNEVSLLGNLGADPELRSTSTGNSVLRLRLATSESYRDRNNQWQERTEWHSVTVWGRQADALHQILAKGSRIFVRGSLRTSSYDDKDGIKRYRTDVDARKILLCGGPRTERQGAPAAQQCSSSGGPPGDTAGGGVDEGGYYDGGDEVPF